MQELRGHARKEWQEGIDVDCAAKKKGFKYWEEAIGEDETVIVAAEP